MERCNLQSLLPVSGTDTPSSLIFLVFCLFPGSSLPGAPPNPPLSRSAGAPTLGRLSPRCPQPHADLPQSMASQGFQICLPTATKTRMSVGQMGQQKQCQAKCLRPGRSDRLVSVVGAVDWPWSSLPPVRTWNSMAQPSTSGSVSLSEARPTGVPAGGGGAQVLEWSPCSWPGNGHTTPVLPESTSLPSG